MNFSSRQEKFLSGATGVTVGTFDGVHRGHKLVVETLKRECEERGLIPVVITFEPHPLAVVAPERTPKLLEDAREREERLAGFGVNVEVLEFNEGLRKVTVEEWFAKLRNDYNAKFLLVGYDNSFGSDGKGKTILDYAEIGARHDLEVLEAPQLDGVSSSRIRKAIERGDMEEAAGMLGRYYSLEGEVVHGRAQGRELGFPTANVEIAPARLLLAPGVYAADVTVKSGEVYRSVVNIGKAPTFSDNLPLTLEAHLLGFQGDLYGEKVSVKFIKRLRDEKKFSNLEELIEAIAEDVRSTKSIMSTKSSMKTEY